MNKYSKSVELINNAKLSLSGNHDIHSQNAMTYLALAAGCLIQGERINNQQNAARKRMEEIGRNKHKEWLEKIKENISKTKLDDEPGIVPDSV